MAAVRSHRRRVRGARAILVSVICSVLVAGCGDDPAGPEDEVVVEEGIEPPQGVVVSNPIASAAAFSGAASSGVSRNGAASNLVYISARPGTFPDAQELTITHTGTGSSVTVAPVDGGFDPVALPAAVGDEITIRVEFTDNSTIEYTSTIPDRKRPRVVRSRPPNGATDVVLSVQILIVFSEPMDQGSVGEEDVQLLLDGESVEGSLEWSDDGLTSWFQPAEPLLEGRSYQLVVSTVGTDLEGDALEEGLSATFTTAAQILSVSAGGYHACALRADGVVICWGDNTLGQCGRPISEIEPPQAVPTDLRFASITSGHVFTCGLTVRGEAYCWGWNFHGQLGDGSTVDKDVPVAVAGGHTFTSLTAGSHHTCGITSDGTAYCWGRQDFLQAGPGLVDQCVHDDGSYDCIKSPARVGSGFRYLSAGGLFTCGIKVDGGSYCWGGDHIGQLGTDNDFNIESCSGYRCSRVPRAITGGHEFVQVSSGWGHVCGVTADGGAYCWGNNRYGSLGAGFSSWMVRESTPLAVVGGQSYRSLSAGSDHTCGLTVEGRILCWGLNEYGELGIGDSQLFEISTPQEVAGSHTFRNLSSPECAIGAEGGVYCWGSNRYGQLGQDPASLEISHSPVLVPVG